MDGFNLGDVISLIIVFVIYLFAASGKTKKGMKRRGRGASMRTRAQGEQADRRAQARDQQTHAGFGDAFGNAQEQCGTKRIHLHEVSQQQFAMAAEGEDPCHAGEADVPDDMPFDSQREADDAALAQDVLRGVIMSEILTRPHDRAAMRRGRR